MTYATAQEIAKALGAKRSGRGWVARCPAHDDHQPSFSITDAGQGRPLVYCHAGCDQRAVIASLRAKDLWGVSEGQTDPSRPLGVTYAPSAARAEEEAQRTAKAREIWDAARPFRGSLAETYLRSRSVSLLLPCLDTMLRFAPALRHPEGGVFPALVAAILDGHGRFLGVQRTYLAADGVGKANVKPAKLTIGPMRDGAVRLAPVSETLGIAEGIETALSAIELYAMPTWAALSAVRLSAITPPKSVRQIAIFADAGKVGTEEAFKAQEAYEAKGYAVEVILPGAHFGAADDFNTALKTLAA